MTAPLDSLLADADLCVKCGLCAPHCPTYRLTADENQSPRGRIALIQGWASGRLLLTAVLRAPLDDCLLCRNCESVCPAKVPYGKIMDRFRTETGQRHKPLATRAVSAAVRGGLRNPALSQLGRKTLGGIVGLLGATPWKALASELPPPGDPATWYGKHPAASSTAHVGLFLGCTAAAADAATVAAILKLLPALGVSVTVPEAQACCGAMDLHAGAAAKARSLIARNNDAFSGLSLDAVISFASGCGATLQEYAQLSDAADARTLSTLAIDISRFLAERVPEECWNLAPLEAKVLVHNPCSLRNVCKSDSSVEQLLRKIPGLEVSVLPGKGGCCGAAGSYMLDHRAMAEAIRAETIEAILADSPDYLATSNIGCALHLRAGLRGLADIPVIHPVQLLARSQRT